MTKITILYPAKPGSRFDLEYYRTTHVPLAIELMGDALRSVTVDHYTSQGAPWPEPAIEVIATFDCVSLAAYQQALAMHGARLQADLPNYTDLTPIILVGEAVPLPT